MTIGEEIINADDPFLEVKPRKRTVFTAKIKKTEMGSERRSFQYDSEWLESSQSRQERQVREISSGRY